MAPTAVVFTDHDVVEPDGYFISEARVSIITRKNIQGAPDLVVEILSPSTASQDKGPKLTLYDRGGVHEYWIVDVDAKTLEVHEFGRPRRTRVYEAGQSFQSEVLSGLILRLDDIFPS